MRATIANMRKLEAAGVSHKAVAYSPYTFEENSATPGDYWNLPAEQCLMDDDRNEMKLVVRQVKYVSAKRYLPGAAKSL